ncbi:MAG: bifunctional pyr operon transcriptional regulator/uracil phosphoribosyltransferase PyrR [Azospira oryzae]|nr:MAG: bifunctional pyr operon transcriptional regulator/uracil phosphoribosyltransferase PyrR [Azospira oryzae]PZP81827.1 MAG: bifunctional pyr operon transcriptional regulator/uracil phosphoribosyltransferase PyrR [Azospira oryzae]
MGITRLPEVGALLARLQAAMRPAVTENTALVGIHTGGVWVAERLHAALGVRFPLGTLDVSFYRDDYGQRGLHREVKRSCIPFEVEGRDIVLVDDVLYTGRTIRAAMNELFDYGRPARIRLAALLDRGGRELPICPQFVGAEVQPADDEVIALIRDEGGELRLAIERKDD